MLKTLKNLLIISLRRILPVYFIFLRDELSDTAGTKEHL